MSQCLSPLGTRVKQSMPTEHMNHHAVPTMTSTTITVLINNTSFTLHAPAKLVDAVTQFGIQPPFAAAVNLQFVPNTRYPQTPLHDGDRIDLIAPVTGG